MKIVTQAIVFLAFSVFQYTRVRKYSSQFVFYHWIDDQHSDTDSTQIWLELKLSIRFLKRVFILLIFVINSNKYFIKYI